MFRWEDGTVGTFFAFLTDSTNPACGAIIRAGSMFITYCFWVIHILCEQSRPEDGIYINDQGILDIQLPRPSDPSIDLTHEVCPSGHWTHRFLACDTKSVCWLSEESAHGIERDSRSKVATSCQSPLWSLFECRSGVEHVPYSLVCDHSPDCMDDSDEDFCFYPPCSDGAQFECMNKQVN